MWLVWNQVAKLARQVMRLMISYGLIAFAVGTGISAVAGRLFNVPWLFGQIDLNDPGMAMSTGLSVVALGVGMFLLHSVWKEKVKRKNCK